MAGRTQAAAAAGRAPSPSNRAARPPPQSATLLSAYLLKQSAGKWKRKRWNQRWFVLDREHGVLKYFRHASPLEAVPLRQDAHGVVALKQPGVALVVQGDLPRGVPTPFCFTVLADGQSQVRLCADTTAEFRLWTSAISAIISPPRTGSRGSGEAKSLPTRTLSSSSSSSVSPSPLPSPVLPSSPSTEMTMQSDDDRTVTMSSKDDEILTLVAQIRALLGDGSTLLIMLNPLIVLVRFGSVPSWYLLALLANTLCVWLLWFRSAEPGPKSVAQLVATRRPTSSTVVDDSSSPSPTAAASATSNTQAPRDESRSRHRSTGSVERAATSPAVEAPPKRVAFAGKVNGVKVAAGASVRMCGPAPMEIVAGCWTQIDATRFNVRQGPNYRKTKQKAASATALLDLVAIDVYQTGVKVDNIGGTIDLSSLKSSEAKLDLFIVNCQVPAYQPSNPLWGEKQGDGPGFSFVTYFAIPPAIRTMLDASVEPPLQSVRLLKEFMQQSSWVSERFKAIGIVVNPQEQRLGRAERHLLETYNGQPILTRPQHRFYESDDYFEVDVDAHEFNYVARKGLVGVSEHACNMVLDFGFVLEGQEDHELPEQILGSVRLCQIDVRQAPWLS